MTNVQKEVGEIIQAVEDRGFDVKLTEGGHYKVYYEGKAVLIEDAPGDATSRRSVTIPATPSDPRWRENTVADLKRARVLDEDPKKAGQQGLTPEDEERRERERQEAEDKRVAAEAGRASQSEQAKERAATVAALRERAERVLNPIGVWTPGTPGGAGHPRRSLGEAARVAFAWAVEEKIEPIPASRESAHMTFKKLYDQSGGLSEPSTNIVTRFLDEIENHGGADRYFELLRETLGITAGPDEDAVAAASPGAKPPTAVEPLPIEDEDDLRVRDLRERLESERKDYEERIAAKEAEVAERERALAEAAGAVEAERIARVEAEQAAQTAAEEAIAAASNGNGRLPEIAFEALGEMIGAYVVVGEQEDLPEALRLIAEKKAAAVALAKRIAALEMGLDFEEVEA